MDRLIEVLDVGDGGFASRSKHLAYIAMPEEYIIVPKQKYCRLMLTNDGEELVRDRLSGLRYGYIDYEYVNIKTISSIAKNTMEKIEQMSLDLSALETFLFNTH